MEYRKLGQTDITVSAIAMGCWAVADPAMWGPQDEAQTIAAVHKALEVGVNFFDTAEAYGEDGYSEVVLGRALAGRRHEAVIATKVSRGELSARDIIAACEDSLRRLNTDYIDLYQIHWPSRTTPIDESMAALTKLRDAGKIRAIGVSNFGPGDLGDALAAGRVESNQLPYSLLFRAIEYEIIPACVQHNVSVLPYSPLLQGLLTGKFANVDAIPAGRKRTRHFSASQPLARHGESGAETEVFAAIEAIRATSERVGAPMSHVAIAWLLHQPGVTSVIAGARSREQVAENAQAASLKLAPDVLEALRAATDAIKQKLGPNPDMWRPAARSRYR